jgi:outer membrane protein assembly factor BamB
MVAAARPSSAAEKTTADWPQFRGPNRDGISADTGLLKSWPKEGPPLAWQAGDLGKGFSSVAIAGGKIFTMGDIDDSAYLFALDLKDGKKLWSKKVGKKGGRRHDGPRSTPTVDGDRVYVLGQLGDLVCFMTGDGLEAWRKSLPKDLGGTVGVWNYCESPLVDGDKLICTPGGKTATLAALDKKTGAIVWKAAVPGGSRADYASAVISEAAGVRQYVQLMAVGVVGIAAKDGKFLWKYDKLGRNTANVPNPIVQGDYIFCAAGYGKGGALLKLSAADNGIRAEEVYYEKALKNRHGGVVMAGDYIYGDLDQAGKPWCALWKTGKVVWQKKGGGPGGGSAAVTYADGLLYFRYQNGVMALVAPAPGANAYKEISTFKIPNVSQPSWSHPVVAGGKLYLREQDTLYCYDIKAKN